MVTEWQKLVCSTCGGTLEEKGGKLVCAHCKSTYQAKEKISETEVIALNSATVDRNRYRFDDAQEKYDLILKDYPENAEANWGAFLCSYGIIYEEDYDGEFVPTCHRLSERPVSKSPYYAKLTATQKKRAEEIEELRLKILEETKKVKPYDVFICYKQNEEKNGVSVPTRESKWARDIYEKLTNKYKLRVFFAEKSLSGSNADYEPHIYAALRSAKLMFVLTTSLEHLNAVWVANEWKRYVSYIRAGEDKTIRVVYDSIEPYDLPKELQAKQAIDHDSNWMEAILSAVENLPKTGMLDRIEIKGGKMGKKSAQIQTETLQTREIGAGGTDASVSEKQEFQIVKEYLDNGGWEESLKMLKPILRANPNSAEALWYKLLVDKKVKGKSSLKEGLKKFDKKDFSIVEKVLNLANKEFAEELLDALYAAANVCDEEPLLMVLKTILPYDYKNRNKRIQETFKAVTKKGYFKAFNILLATINSDKVDAYIKYNLLFANSTKAEFKNRVQCVNNVLSVDEGNIEALGQSFKLLFESGTYEQNKERLEKLLRFSKVPDDEVVDLLKYCAKNVKNEKMCAFAMEIVKYYSGDLKNVAEILLDLGTRELEIACYKNATEIFELLVKIYPDEPSCYLGVCLAKVEAKTMDNVLKSDKSLAELPEYKKYLTMVDADTRKTCMEITKQQEESIKERKDAHREETKTKTLKWISILSIVASIILLLLTLFNMGACAVNCVQGMDWEIYKMSFIWQGITAVVLFVVGVVMMGFISW